MHRLRCAVEKKKNVYCCDGETNLLFHHQVDADTNQMELLFVYFRFSSGLDT